MDASPPPISSVRRLLAKYRELDDRDLAAGGAGQGDSPVATREHEPDEIAEFARRELARISDYVAQEVSELSGSLKSLRAKIKQQAALIEEMGAGIESSMSNLGASPQAGAQMLEDVITRSFGDLLRNTEALGQCELSLAASLQFQDRMSQEIEQLRKLLAHSGKVDVHSRIHEIAKEVKLADIRTRLLAHFGEDVSPSDEEDDAVELF